MTQTLKHPGELALRRLLADEPVEFAAHVTGCAECTARLEKLRDEQRQFEQAIPFERFAAGVEKAARVQQRPAPSRRWVTAAAAMAAALLAVVGLRFVGSDEGTSRVKGGAQVEFVVAGEAGQRNAGEVEPLAKGERVRIGVSGAKYALVVAIDERGEVSPVYDEVVRADGQTWLPEAIEFTGAGREIVWVILSEERQSTSAISIALRKRFDDVKGDLSQLGALDVPGSQVHRTFIKP